MLPLIPKLNPQILNPIKVGNIALVGRFVAEANALTHSDSCPDSLQPELKVCAVQLVAIAQAGGLQTLSVT